MNGDISHHTERVELHFIGRDVNLSSSSSIERRAQSLPKKRTALHCPCICFQAREETRLSGNSTVASLGNSNSDCVSPITLQESQQRWPQRSHFFSAPQSWQFFLQALIVWTVICLPGNIFTFVLYRDVEMGEEEATPYSKLIRVNGSSFETYDFQARLHERCGPPVAQIQWISCSLSLLRNMSISYPTPSCSPTSFSVNPCFNKLIQMKEVIFIKDNRHYVMSPQPPVDNGDEHEYLCHETHEVSSYYMTFSTFWLEGICVLVVGGFGLIGNVMTLIVLGRIDSNTTYNKLLMTLAIVDFLLIFYYFMDYGVIGTFYRSQKTSEPLWYRLAYPYFLHPFRQVVVSASIFMIVAISAERHRAICYPLTHRPAFWPYFLLVLSIAGCQNIPKLFEFKLDFDASTNTSDYNTTPLNEDQRYITFSSWWDELIVTGIIPFLALVIFNSRIYLKLKASDRLEYRFVGKKVVSKGGRIPSQRKKLAISTTTGETSLAVGGGGGIISDDLDEEDENTLLRAKKLNSASSSTHFRKRREKSAMILMSIVLTFLFCHTFRLVTQAYEVTHPSHSTPEHHFYCRERGRMNVPVAFHVMLGASNLLLVVNSSMNFIIYCCVGRTFREELQNILKGIFRKS